MLISISSNLEQKIQREVKDSSLNLIKWACLNNKQVENTVYWTLLINVQAEIEETLNPECMRLFKI